MGIFNGNKKNKGEKETDAAIVKNAPFPQRPALDKAWFPNKKRDNADRMQTTFYDASDYYANNYHNYILFTSVISGNAVKFKAFLTSFEDQFKSDWNSEQVYGRNDPIQTFKNTTRTISIGWDCPAGSIYEAKSNMAASAELIRMLYPSYERTGNVSTIKKSPMIKVRFRNLIKSDSADSAGLLVTIDGLNFSPEIEAGFFDADESKIIDGKIPENELIPKLLKFSCTMTVIHRQTIGYDENNNWPTDLISFPNLIADPGASNGGAGDFDFPKQDKFFEDQKDFHAEELKKYQALIMSSANETVSGDANLSDAVAKIANYHDGLSPFASDSAAGAGFSLGAGINSPPPPKIIADIVNQAGVNSVDAANSAIDAVQEEIKEYHKNQDLGDNR